MTPELPREFRAHLSKPDDETVTLYADGRAVRYRSFEPPGAQTSVPRLWVPLRARRPLWDPLATVLVAVAVAIIGVTLTRRAEPLATGRAGLVRRGFELSVIAPSRSPMVSKVSGN